MGMTKRPVFENVGEESSYDRGPVLRLGRVCWAMTKWARLIATPHPDERSHERDFREKFTAAWDVVNLAIIKSAVLDRVLYGGEDFRTRRCPIHRGRWIGLAIVTCALCQDTGWIDNEISAERIGDTSWYCTRCGQPRDPKAYWVRADGTVSVTDEYWPCWIPPPDARSTSSSGSTYPHSYEQSIPEGWSPGRRGQGMTYLPPDKPKRPYRRQSEMLPLEMTPAEVQWDDGQVLIRLNGETFRIHGHEWEIEPVERRQ
jgi:hypothetical protein